LGVSKNRESKFMKNRLKENVLQETVSKFYKQQKRILVYIGNEILPVDTNDILFVFSENNYRFINTRTSIYNVNYTLDNLEEMLGDRYFRANRQFIISFDAIKKIFFFKNSGIKVELKEPYNYTITVSRRKIYEFKKWLVSCP